MKFPKIYHDKYRKVLHNSLIPVELKRMIYLFRFRHKWYTDSNFVSPVSIILENSNCITCYNICSVFCMNHALLYG